MDAPAIGFDAKDIQNTMLKAAGPFQAAWKHAFELPLALTSEALRFAALRFQAQSDFFASLEGCHTVSDVLEAQSQFVRNAVDDYGTETSKVMSDMRKSVSLAA